MKFYVPVTIYAWIDCEEEADTFEEAARTALRKVEEMDDKEFGNKLHVMDMGWCVIVTDTTNGEENETFVHVFKTEEKAGAFLRDQYYKEKRMLENRSRPNHLFLNQCGYWGDWAKLTWRNGDNWYEKIWKVASADLSWMEGTV